MYLDLRKFDPIMGGICSTSSDFADYLKKDEAENEEDGSSSKGDSYGGAMSDVFDPSERVRVQAHVRSMDDYRAMYKVKYPKMP